MNCRNPRQGLRHALPTARAESPRTHVNACRQPSRTAQWLPPLNFRACVLAAFMLGMLSVTPALAQYQADIDRWTAQDALDPPAPGAVLFAGSSSIRRWEQMSLDFADYRVLQRGFGGAHFDHLNTYMNDIVLPYQPTAIVIWAGTNDIASGAGGAEVYADYLAFVSAVLAAQPTVHIFYLGIMPTPGRWANGPEETIANNAIAAYAAGDSRLHYIDLPAVFFTLNPPDDPAFTGLFVDDIHLNRQGYELWTSIIRPQVEAVIAPNKTYTPNPDTPGPGARLLFDFGPSNPIDGDHTVSPDAIGHWWNNWHDAEGEVAINAGEHLADLIDDQGTPTGIGLIITGGFLSNGKVNGGLLTPSPLLLGDLAIATATQDYFYCGADNLVGGGDDNQPGGFMLTGLHPDLAYDFRFFASRNTTQTRITEFKVIGANQGAAALETSGNNIGHDGAYDGNDNAFAEVRGIRPDRFGQVFVDVTLLAGSYAYINAMDVSVRRPGDWDIDGDIDIIDALPLIACLSGPEQTPPSVACLAFYDLEVNGRVDLGDFAVFQRIFATPWPPND